MGLAYKQLLKQIGRNKTFVTLLFLLTVLSSLMFYFVTFSIDRNVETLNVLGTLTENQKLFKTALISNTVLAHNYLVCVTGLTAFVFVMFFYRFFRSNKRQIGSLKSLGFKDSSLCFCFVVFVATLSVTGAAVGLIGGYFLADVLIAANMRTYSVTGLVKGINALSLIAGVGGSSLVFCVIAFLCYYFVRGKEAGVLIAGTSNNAKSSLALRVADRLSKIIPIKNKIPFRIAMRKPLSIMLIVAAVMSFSTCMFIGRSLNISSQKVFESQTVGHNYEFDTKYHDFQTSSHPDNAIIYLENHASLTVNGYEIECLVIGLYNLTSLYKLQNVNGELLPVPNADTAYINPGLADTYGVNVGDRLSVMLAGNEQTFTVTEIAANAKSAAIYVNAGGLAGMLGAADSAYNGILSNVPINGIEMITNAKATNSAERIEQLNLSAVSNDVSAVINQAVGGVVGIILIFLALYLNFQDNSRDMLLLHMMGYQEKYIRKLLVNIYMPIIWSAFILTLAPSILLAKDIQKSLSISTNDYMPFMTDIATIIIVFIILNIIYWLVQGIFRLGINQVIAKEEMSEFVYAE